jgi:two-component system chemotaxis response regulator CheY
MNLEADLSDTKKTVVIVDDSETARAHLAQFFSENGFKIVAEFENGEGAVEFMKSNSPDLVCMDIVMPVMDGIEAYRKIKDAKPDARIFFYSVLARDPKVIQSFKDEIAPELFVAKPSTPQVFLAKINQLMDKPVLKALP